MADGTKRIGSGSSAPQSSPTPLLPRDASKEQLLQAIRRLMYYLKQTPSSTDAKHHFGPSFFKVAGKFFDKPLSAIRAATSRYTSDPTREQLQAMIAERDALAQKLGREPTPADIDNCLEMAPAYAYKMLGLLNNGQTQSVKPDHYNAGRPTRGTLAAQSSFQSRAVPAFTPTQDFKGNRDPRKVEAEEDAARVQRVMAAPLPREVANASLFFEGFVDEEPDLPAKAEPVVTYSPPVAPAPAAPPFIDGKHLVEIALIAKKMEDGNYARKLGARMPLSSEFAEYVAQHGKVLVPRFWLIQSLEGAAEKISTDVVIYFYVCKEKDSPESVSGIRIINASDIPVGGLPRDVTELHFKYSPRHKLYLMVKANGSAAIDYVIRWLESHGVTVGKGLETNFLARTFGTKAPLHTTLWSDLESRLETEGGKFFERLWYISHPEQPLPKRIAFIADQREFNQQLQADAMRFEKVSVLEDIANTVAWMILEYSEAINTYVVKSAGGPAGQSLGFAWLRSHGIDTSRLSVRSFITLLWSKTKKTVLTLAKDESLLIADLKADLARPDYIPDLLQTRSLLESNLNRETSSVTVVTQCRPDKTTYSGLRLLTAEEITELAKYGTYTRVTLKKTGGDRFVTTSAVGREGKQFMSVGTQINDITQVAGTLTTKTWGFLEQSVQSISSDFMRGGTVLFLGDKFSDAIVNGRMPNLDPARSVVDYTSLAVGNAAGGVVATNVMRFPADSVMARAVRTFFAMMVQEYSRTGHVNWRHLPTSAGNMLASSSVVSAMKYIFGIGQASIWGAVATTVADLVIFKKLSEMESRVADTENFNIITERVSEMLSADQVQLAQVMHGDHVPVEELLAMDKWLQDGEKQLRSQPSQQELQVMTEYAHKLETLRDNFQARMRWGIYARIYPDIVAQQYNDASIQIESERDVILKKLHDEADHTFTPLAVDPAQSESQLIDQVDEDDLKADIDIDGNPQHSESALQFQTLLARNGQALADQLTRYRQDRQTFIARVLQN